MRPNDINIYFSGSVQIKTESAYTLNQTHVPCATHVHKVGQYTFTGSPLVASRSHASYSSETNV